MSRCMGAFDRPSHEVPKGVPTYALYGGRLCQRCCLAEARDAVKRGVVVGPGVVQALLDRIEFEKGRACE